MTDLETAALLEANAVPVCLWPTGALRSVAVTDAPPPPTRPRWVKSADDWQLMLGELTHCYDYQPTGGEVL